MQDPRVKFTEHEAQELAELFRGKILDATQDNDPKLAIYDVISQWIAIPAWMLIQQPQNGTEMFAEYLDFCAIAIQDLQQNLTPTNKDQNNA